MSVGLGNLVSGNRTLLGNSVSADTWEACPVSDRELEDAYLTNAAFDVHVDDPGVRLPVRRR